MPVITVLAPEIWEISRFSLWRRFVFDHPEKKQHQGSAEMCPETLEGVC